MKTIMENWNRFLKEEPKSAMVAPDQAEDALAKMSQDLEEPAPELSPIEKGQAEDVIKQLIALQLGTEAAAGTGEQVPGEDIDEGRAQRSARRRRRERIERVKEIKRMAGLSGIKLEDFTPEQKEVYAQAKAALKAKKQEDRDVMATTIAHNLSHGDLLKNPVAKKILDKLPDMVKTALLIAAGDNCATSGAITLTCLLQGYASNSGLVD